MSERLERPSFKELSGYQAWLFDTDGTTADTSEIAINFVKRLLGIFCPDADLNFSNHEVDEWKYITKVLMERGFSLEDAKKIDRNIWNRKWVLKNAKPIKGAPELVKYLYRPEVV